MERYFLYTVHGGALWRGQVHHPPYQVRGAQVDGLDESLLAAAGIPRPRSRPWRTSRTGWTWTCSALKRA